MQGQVARRTKYLSLAPAKLAHPALASEILVCNNMIQLQEIAY